MKRLSKERKRLLLLILLLTVTVGFALLSTTLKIDGFTGIKGNTWDIHWNENSIHETDGSVEANTPAYVSDGEKKIVTFDVDLELPGDFYEFTVDAKNYGTIAGAIEDVEITFYEDDGETPIDEEDLPDYILYSFKHADGSNVPNGEIIKPGKSISYKFRIEFDRNATEVPHSTGQLNPQIKVIYIQHTTDPEPVYNLADIVYFDPVSNSTCDS